PLIDEAVAFAREGIVTGASSRNWESYGQSVRLASGIAPWQQALLTDPQTSGGLLVSCAPETADEVLRLFHEAGFDKAAVIGSLSEGAAVAGIRD
ncbi:MAG: selenide, water dikinase SelD, partial [Burkholderiales bacterium]|nr:selenide, water dikinase SelD [Burkholderiales bacterium]